VPSKERVLRLVRQGLRYEEIGQMLRIPPGQAYLIATGIPADGGDTVTRVQREREGFLPSRTQRLVNPREVSPTGSERVRRWIRDRVASDSQMRQAAAGGASGFGGASGAN
jgi:hypothetical protein